MGNLLSRNQLLEKEELTIEKVTFEDGNFICVRQMTGHERDLFEQSLIKKIRDAKGNITYEQATDDFRAKLAVVTVCNEKGESILLPGDFPLLSKNMSAKRLEKIINTAQKLNAITEEDKENILKNSEVGQADNSGSDSV
jgi:hypothetical protein